MKLLDIERYIDKFSVFEKDENQKILDLIHYWTMGLKNNLSDKVIGQYYQYPEFIRNDTTMNVIVDLSDIANRSFISIIENMKYVYLQDPYPTIKKMFEEVVTTIPDDICVKDIYYKTISEFNFTESKMSKPEHCSQIQMKNEGKNIDMPNILSMTSLYYENPLMWPLIFHEYGHTIFNKSMHESKINKEYDKLIQTKRDRGLEKRINNNKLTTIISEIFSDIFAINYYGTNYFFAFYFHEILSKDNKKLMKIVENNNIQSHPPSYFRMKYMMKEITKRNLEDDPFKSIKTLQKEYINELTKYMDEEKEVMSLFEDIYDEISLLFDTDTFKPKNKLDSNLTTVLYNYLKEGNPVGTSFSEDIDLEKELGLKKTFNLENNNSILNIIQAGWKFLIIDMIDDYYKKDDYNDYLNFINLNDEEKLKDNKLIKFDKGYIFLLSNLNYSIETSMIVSNFY